MNQEKVSHLLSQAGGAHHTYEQTVLNDVYDQEWPAWYAEYAIKHGLNELLPQAVNVEQLSHFLTESFQRYEQSDQGQTWADFIAADLANHFG